MKNIFEDKKKSRIIWISLFVVSCIFYLVWYMRDGVIMTPDGETYVAMSSLREPVYCIFLWIFRALFGAKKGLDAAVIVQCLIAGLAVTVLAKALQRRFGLPLWGMLGIVVIEYGITLLNLFVAKRRYSYYNSICSEALAYSFWIFFFVSLLGILYDRDKKSILTCCIWCVIMVLVRKQMLISFCLLFLALVYAWWKEKKPVKACLCALLVVIAGFMATQVGDRAYNYVMRGEFAPHTGDSSFIFGNEIYVADEDMVSYISSKQNQEIFLEIMRRADEQQYNIQYAGEGWMGLEDHYSLSYDNIKFNVTMVVVREYLREQGVPDEDFNAHYEKIANEMTVELLVPCIPDMIKIFGANVIFGFVTSVLKVHPLLNWGAVFLYAAYIVLWIWLCRRNKDRAYTQILLFGTATILAIAVNVVFTSLTIYCQMRYMLYNTAFFYQSGLIMLIEGYRSLKGSRITDKR